MLAFGWIINSAGSSESRLRMHESFRCKLQSHSLRKSTVSQCFTVSFEVDSLQNKTTTRLQLLAVDDIFFPIPRDTRDWADIEHESLELYIHAPASLGLVVREICFVGFCWVCVHRSYTLESQHGTWKSPNWRGKSSSKPPFLGSMLVFGGVYFHLLLWQKTLMLLVTVFYRKFQGDLSHISSLYSDEGVFDLRTSWRDQKVSLDIQDLKGLILPIHRSGSPPVARETQLKNEKYSVLPCRISSINSDRSWGLNTTNSCRRMSFWGRLFDHPELQGHMWGQQDTHAKSQRFLQESLGNAWSQQRHPPGN